MTVQNPGHYELMKSRTENVSVQRVVIKSTSDLYLSNEHIFASQSCLVEIHSIACSSGGKSCFPFLVETAEK